VPYTVARSKAEDYSALTTMLVQIHLDQPQVPGSSGSHFTNLDVITGKVILKVPNPTNVSNVVVKLEGESRTRLLAPVRPDRPDKQKPTLEVHKFLYKTQIVWPEGLRQEDLLTNSKASFAINAGNYEYPFQFKACIPSQSSDRS